MVLYPNESWAPSVPKDLGWSTQKLTEVARFLQTVPEGSLMVVEKGRVIAEWGDIAKPVKLSSVRKSLLSALYGIYAHEGRIDLSMTLKQLAIDDVPPLTTAERQATVRDILKARSGIYRGFVGGTPAMRAQMPTRGSHAPGTFWYYNDWDFNVAGTIFEQQVRLDLGVAFRDRVGTPLQMQDFRAEDVYYVTAPPEKPPDETSTHRAYQFRMSTRDLARFGYLFLRGGNWRGSSLIPPAWVLESTLPHSDADGGSGYGYFWWINDWPGVSEPHYTAKGALGKNLVIFPSQELVVIYLNHTEYPDDSSSSSEEDLRKLPKLEPDQMVKLLQLILKARPE